MSMHLQVAAQQERERQWRVARGEEPAGPGPNAGPAQRETWMTELPPERRPGMGPPSQVSQTAFSRQGIRGRGDTSEWTDTPETRAARHMQVGPARACWRAGVQHGCSVVMLMHDEDPRSWWRFHVQCTAVHAHKAVCSLTALVGMLSGGDLCSTAHALPSPAQCSPCPPALCSVCQSCPLLARH